MEKQYTIPQVASILGIKPRTVRDWITKKKIVAKKYPQGRCWLVAQSEIERIQKEMR